MTPPFIRKESTAPSAEERLVEIDADSFEQCQALAKRQRTSVKVIINSALHAWLGMR